MLHVTSPLVTKGAGALNADTLLVAARRGPSLLQVRRYANIDGGGAGKKRGNKGADAEADDGGVVVGLEPLTDCVLELRRRFGDVALFFYDAVKADAVYVVLRPSFFLPTTFR